MISSASVNRMPRRPIGENMPARVGKIRCLTQHASRPLDFWRTGRNAANQERVRARFVPLRSLRAGGSHAPVQRPRAVAPSLQSQPKALSGTSEPAGDAGVTLATGSHDASRPPAILGGVEGTKWDKRVRIRAAAQYNVGAGLKSCRRVSLDRCGSPPDQVSEAAVGVSEEFTSRSLSSTGRLGCQLLAVGS